jgi:hypothetical protein
VFVVVVGGCGGRCVGRGRGRGHAAVRGDRAGRPVDVFAKQRVDALRDRDLARRKRHAAKVLAADATVLVVGTGTPPLAGVDPVLAVPVLPDDSENLATLGMDDHALREGTLGPSFDTFVTVGFLSRHASVLPKRGRTCANTSRPF